MFNCLGNLNAFQITGIGLAIAFIFARCKTATELNIVGNLVVAMGSALLSIAAIEDANDTAKDNQAKRDDIKDQLAALQKRLDCYNG